jgi:CheY-like chemotaxis protein
VKEAQAAPERSDEEKEANVPKTVLVADDSATIKKAFELTFLGIDDVEIITAGSGAEVLQTARNRHPDLIITDSRFGDISGYDLCRQVKGEADLRDIPVWIMTGPFERLDDALYDACGAEGHVRKPFDTQRMIDAVQVLHAPPEEEKARPSYPAVTSASAMRPVGMPAGSPSIPRAAPPRPPVAAVQKPPSAMPVTPKAGATLHGQAPPSIADTRRPGKATMIGTPIVPPARPVGPVGLVGLVGQLPAEPKPAAVQKPAARPMESTLRPHVAPRIDRPAFSEGPVEEVLSMESARALLDSLSPQQKEQFLGVMREVVEKIAWEIVPDLAATIIKEELNRLLKD